MSKELEALGRLASFDKKCEFISKQTKDDFRLVEQALERNEPMKVIYGTLPSGLSGVICPKCKCCRVSRKVNTNIKFCEQCGQKLDWSDEK